MILTVSELKHVPLAEISCFVVEKVLSDLFKIAGMQRYHLAKVEKRKYL
jgi:hypothetical protein